MNICEFKRLGAPGECDWGPRGLPDPCHFIPQQRIKIALQKRGLPKHEWPAILWDTRIYGLGCRHHHTMFDSGHWKLMREDQYPDRVRAWAEQHKFYWASSRDGWRAEHVPKEAA